MKSTLCLITAFILLSFTGYSQSLNDQLLEAAVTGDMALVEKCLLNPDLDINHKDKDGYTALELAIERNKKAVFTRIITFFSLEKSAVIPGLSSDTRADKAMNELMLAVLADNPIKTSELLTDKFPVNTLHWSGYSLLSIAVRWESLKIIHQLLAKGADVNQVNKNRYNTTPFIEMTRQGNKQIAELLLQKGAKINIVDVNNDPALNWSVFFGDLEIVEWLLKNGARTDLVGRDSGDNALAIARRMKFAEIEKLLLNYSK